MIVEIRKRQPEQVKQSEAAARYEARRALAEAQDRAAQHPYDELRPKMPPIEFANHVLTSERLLFKHHGHDWVDGKYATPALKIDAASAALERLGLKPIELGRKR